MHLHGALAQGPWASFQYGRRFGKKVLMWSCNSGGPVRPQVRIFFASASCARKWREEMEGRWAPECELEIEVSLSRDD